jgi:hypothetical protein
MFVDESPPTTAADPVAPAEQAAGGPGAARGGESDDLSAVRTLILEAHPDVVPDLVTGSTVAELLASVEGARAAYAAVAGKLAAMTADDGLDGRPASPPMIPGGGGAPLPVDPDRLPASEKIRRGLRATVAATREGPVR